MFFLLHLTLLHFPLQRNDKIAISLPAHNLFRSEAGDHLPLEVRYPSKLNITVNVSTGLFIIYSSGRLNSEKYQ